jgi:hypothetical protein
MSSFQEFTPLGFIRFHSVALDLSLVLRARLTNYELVPATAPPTRKRICRHPLVKGPVYLDCATAKPRDATEGLPRPTQNFPGTCSHNSLGRSGATMRLWYCALTSAARNPKIRRSARSQRFREAEGGQRPNLACLAHAAIARTYQCHTPIQDESFVIDHHCHVSSLRNGDGKELHNDDVF